MYLEFLTVYKNVVGKLLSTRGPHLASGLYFIILARN